MAQIDGEKIEKKYIELSLKYDILQEKLEIFRRRLTIFANLVFIR